MKLILTIFYSFCPGNLEIERPQVELVSIYVEHMPEELKKIKRSRWWPTKPFTQAG